ncbi:MAG: LamG-like jellyroll fold domain-containing protein [Planctomycetota bacterium]|jgi:hypothetical protein
MLKATISGKPDLKTFKVMCCLVIFIALGMTSQIFAVDAYDLIFSTYFGGSNWEHARDVVVDKSGNIYVVGGTASADFPTTSGAYSQSLQTGGSQQFGPCDIFVVKFSPGGTLLWSTLIGGPNYDRAYAVEVDGQGYIYVAGRAGPGFPVKNAFQPDFDGVDNGSYGMQNAFVLKLEPDGSGLVWSSYVGVSTLCRDLAIDEQGDVYVPGGRWNTSKTPPAEWFENAYQKEPLGGVADCGVMKIKSDGSRVLWATWLGGSAQDNSAASIRIGPDGRIFVGGSTFSADFPTTAGAYDRTYSGEADFFVACLTPDGSELVYSTYLGGPGNEWISTHNLAVDDFGNAYVAVPTSSPNYPVTEGAFQQTFRGGNTDWAITKLSPSGALLASTLLGGGEGENPDGIYVGSDGMVFITGETQSADFPVTAGAVQSQKNAGTEAVLVTLSSDLKRLLYATYLGGGANDTGRSGCLGPDGSLYLTGASNGPGWPAKNAYQSTFAGGGGNWGNGDCVLAKLAPARTINVDPAETFQTINGWEMVAFALEPDNPAFLNFKDELFDLAVHDVGINRLRLEIRSGVENINDNWSAHQDGTIEYQTWRSRRYATVNDNTDPYTIDWAGFHFSEMDDVIERVVNPLRAVLEADGDKLYVNVNYVAFTGQITDGIYIHDDPAEYAEFVLATYLHIKEKYGWVPDSWEVLLEPDNVSQWDGTLLGRAIVATAGRLNTAGFEPVFVAPSNTNMGNAITYFDRMVEVPGAVEYLREFSYHRYGGVSLQNLRTIAERARQYGLETSMLEWWSSSNSYRTLHEDLKVGNNSAWQQGVLVGALNSNMALYVVDDSNPANPRLMLNDKTKFTRQYYRFVRPGAIRIQSVSQESSFDPLAFINKDGSYVVVVKCNAGGDFSIGGLVAGTYGIKYTTSSRYDVDLPDQTIGAGQAVITGIPATGVLTVYGKPSLPDDQPPTTPAGLIATDLSTSRLILTWDRSIDNVDIAGYKIYRGGVLLGFSQTNSFEDKKIEPASVYTYEVSAYDTALNESPLSETLEVKTPEPDIRAELLGYWKFEERRGTATMDMSGSGNDGTVVGPKRVPVTTGLALEFDGRDDYVEIAANPDLDNLDAITMVAWIYPHVDGHWHVMDKGDGDKRMYAEGAGLTLDGRIRYTGSHAFSRSVGGTIELNKWQHVAMTWSRATNRTSLYHNGAEVEYSTQEIGSGSVLDDATYPFTIGARGALGEVTFFDGLMDEVRLYGYALGEEEIRDIYNSIAP